MKNNKRHQGGEMNETGNGTQGSTPVNSPTPPPEAKSEKASFVIGIIALCFAALAAAWSFLGGACCGWASWGWAFIGLVLSIVSLVMKRSAIGWWALGLSIFAFIWVFVSAFLITGGLAGAAAGATHGLK